MIDWFVHTLKTYPEIAIFLSLALGYYFGSFTYKGLGLGAVTATLIAAVIIGGTPLSGGWGTVIGAVVGMLIIQVISSGIIFFGIDATWSTFVTGAVIVLAVALDQLVKRQRDRALPS